MTSKAGGSLPQQFALLSFARCAPLRVVSATAAQSNTGNHPCLLISDLVHVLALSTGLCYHDILVDTPAYKTAVARLPEELQEARLRRIRRAFDLSTKKIVLPEDQWADPWREFDAVQAVLETTQRELDEKAELDGQGWAANPGDVTWFEYDVDDSWFWQGIPDRKPETPRLER